MARTAAKLPPGTRVTDYVSLGVLSRAIPLQRVHQVLAESGKASIRQRALPAHVVVYYVILMALYMDVSCREVLRCLVEGLRWLFGPDTRRVIASPAGISQARARLGYAPLQMLYDQLVAPVATRRTKGGRYRKWQVVSLDGSTLDIADTTANEAEFGRPAASRGQSAFPQLRLVSLVENGTHILFGARIGPCATSEVALAAEALSALKAPMLCLADRGFWGFALWRNAAQTGAELLWRVKIGLDMPCHKRLYDGSYLTRVYASDQRVDPSREGMQVRVIEYALEGTAALDEDPKPETTYRLVTTILDPRKAPAHELAALYHERWEIENAFDELKTHLRGARIVLRSKTPSLVRQEFYGLMLAHFAIRSLMHEAALQAGEDPDRLSFVHSVQVIKRHLPRAGGVSPSEDGSHPPIGAQ